MVGYKALNTNGEMIKMICMPIKVDRLGNVLESSSSHKK